ncbi:MAG: oxaloacetate decarboxylase [Paludibacter sp.]|jgi:pyruvate carboxylase subunit B|nr:oxaloacetate decarboxylase [Paludibacter sp.]
MKEIKFSLVYRDMWQSSGKYVPKREMLEKIAPLIIEMGCFSRVETNGGASEQVNLLFGENPNESVRAFTKPFNEVGIKTHMLDRGLNGLRMNPVPADVRRLMYKVKKAQGVDITRIFCGLNDVRNIIPSIKWAKEAGMIPQATMCITSSEVHTAEYYINMSEELIAAGAEEICLKDMAGIGRPVLLGNIVRSIKTNHPDIIVQYHGHSGPGFSMASMLEVAKAGADILDVAMEPLAWGMVHPDVISVQAMLKDAGFKVPEINMNAYMKARKMTQSFIDDYLGYFIDDRNKLMTSLLVGCGLPGGMMGSLMADLKGVHAAINSFHRSKAQPEISEDELLVQLFEEVKYIWPKLGFPPLVTPFSQYVKNIALMNVMNMTMGKGRWQAIDRNSWDMILGKAGKLPGALDAEIIELATKNNYEFFEGNPQDNYPDELPKFIDEMKKNGWSRGKDDEELFEFAMHEKQYRDFKSGEAKRRFEQELESAIREKYSKLNLPMPEIRKIMYPEAEPITAAASGKILWELDFLDRSIEPAYGKLLNENDMLCAIQTRYGVEAIKGIGNARIISVSKKQGDIVNKGDTICYIERVNTPSNN